MPSFVLLQCYQCRIFSPNQETKNSKWACRMCGAKQSILKVHAKTDSAKDLRGIAQQLNAQQGATRSEEFVIQQSPVIASPPMYELYEGGSEEEEGGGESWTFRRGPPPQPMSGSADGYTCQSHHGVRGSDQGEREAFGGQGGSRWSAYLVEDEDGLGRGGNAVGGRGWMNVEATEEDNRLVTAIPTSRSGKDHGRGKGKGGGRGRRDEAQARAGAGGRSSYDGKGPDKCGMELALGVKSLIVAGGRSVEFWLCGPIVSRGQKGEARRDEAKERNPVSRSSVRPYART
jgi:hypothetical protein